MSKPVEKRVVISELKWQLRPATNERSHTLYQKVRAKLNTKRRGRERANIQEIFGLVLCNEKENDIQNLHKLEKKGFAS